MKFGAPFSAGFGSPENWLTSLKVEALNTRIRVEFIPSYAGWYGTYVDSRQQAMRYCEAAERVVQYVPADASVSRQMVSVIRAGAAGVGVSRSARWYDSQTSRRSTLDWKWSYEVLNSIDVNGATKLSAWSVNYLTWALVSPVNSSTCRGYLDVIITVSGGNVTISLQRQGYTLASGACAVGDICYLDAVNGDVTAQVTTDPTIATGTEQLFIRYPESMKILRGTIDPPTVIVATVPFVGEELDGSFTEASDLVPSKRYYYRIRTYSDTGELGVVSPSIVVDISGPPAPAADLALDSSSSNWPVSIDCVFTFTESITPGVEYKLYLQSPSDPYINWNDVYPCVFGSGTFSTSLPATAGTFKLVLRTNLIGGIQEFIGTDLEVEFDGTGAFIPPRPNTPTIMKSTITGGLTVAINTSYDPSREVGVATHIHLYYKAVGGAYNPVPDASDNLVSEGYSKVAAPSVEVPATGWYWFKVVAATAGNVEDSTGDERLIYVSDSATAAPLADGVPTRG